MGEAKRKRDLLRRRLLQECEEWQFDPLPREAEMAKEIARLEIQVAHLATNESAHRAGMRASMCHVNCYRYAEHHARRGVRVASGWLPVRIGRTAVFLHHSVIFDPAVPGYLDITPSVLHEAGAYMDFIPDPDLHLTYDERTDQQGRVLASWELHRQGVAITQCGLRGDPAYVREHLQRVRAAILAGQDPREAMLAPWGSDRIASPPQP